MIADVSAKHDLQIPILGADNGNVSVCSTCVQSDRIAYRILTSPQTGSLGVTICLQSHCEKLQ